jgi:hypothetical protein
VTLVSDFLGVVIVGIKRYVNGDISILLLRGIKVFFLWEDRKRAVCGAHVDKEMNGLTDQKQNGFN